MIRACEATEIEVKVMGYEKLLEAKHLKNLRELSYSTMGYAEAQYAGWYLSAERLEGLLKLIDEYCGTYGDGEQKEALKKKVEGEWIDYVSGANWATCSVCGKSNKILKRWKYCPECGTEMKGIKEKTWK